MTLYSAFRDTATRQATLGPEEYPGVPNLGPEETVHVRDVGIKLVELGGDTVQRHIYWLLPENPPAPGDVINGSRVSEVADARDGAGNVRYWIAYAEQ